jgi:hypothetical protein
VFALDRAETVVKERILYIAKKYQFLTKEIWVSPNEQQRHFIEYSQSVKVA